MDTIFPIECQRCVHVTWMNVDFYKENGDAHLRDVCPHCDYPKYFSLYKLAERNDFYRLQFITVDFFLAKELMERER
ncbi:hypothetical protein HY495_02505 [Candidatus Woesearchaeota archaeon]|nr:hypothetical protein [Candidatus Woesearchaeota archaeon]